jgi:hypothetical protein
VKHIRDVLSGDFLQQPVSIADVSAFASTGSLYSVMSKELKIRMKPFAALVGTVEENDIAADPLMFVALIEEHTNTLSLIMDMETIEMESGPCKGNDIWTAIACIRDAAKTYAGGSNDGD